MIVDDSPTETLILKRLFESESDIEVIACAKDGLEAIKLAEKLHPDVITMDIIMPVVGGVEAIKRIMSTCPVPIVVISSRLGDEVLNAGFRALEAGALAVLDKPVSITSPESKYQLKNLVSTVRAMAEIKVIKRRFAATVPVANKIDNSLKQRHFEVVAIGASAGGPQALKLILASLPENFPLPILVVQHMTRGFMQGFVEWLDNETPLKINYAKHNEIVRSGNVYFAPDDHHLEIARQTSQLVIKLTQKEPSNGFRPSVSVLFNSVAKVCGDRSLAVLLTGMGRDGADGMLEIKHANGHTIVQDQESAVVFGMPGIALSLNAVDKVVSLEQIAGYLVSVTKSSH